MKGILGKDGFDNIEISVATKDGTIFSEMLLPTTRWYWLVCAVSNKPKDVDEVIESHLEGFYDKYSFTLTESNDSSRNYTLDISNYESKQLN